MLGRACRPPKSLSGAGDAAHAEQQPQRKLNIIATQVIGAGAPDLEPTPWLHAPRRGYASLAARLTPGKAVRLGHLLGRAASGNLATICASTWAHVHEAIGGEHHERVVFDDDDRITLIARLEQCLE